MSRQLALLLFSCSLVAQAAGHGVPVTVEAGALRLTLDSAGAVIWLGDGTCDTDYSVAGAPAPLLGLDLGSRVVRPTGMTYDKTTHRLTLVYGQSGIVATVKVLVKPTHVTFALETLRGATPKKILWGPLATTLHQTIGETVGVVRDPRFAIGIQALNIKTLAGARATNTGSELFASCRDRSGRPSPVTGPDAVCVGSKIALFGCLSDRALETIGKIELAEGLPHPMLRGVWAKMSPEATRSYLIMPFGERDLDRVLAVARQAGLKYIYHGNPFKSWGHFGLKRVFFPDGEASLRRCVERAARVGVGVGIHTLSNFIQPNDPYVSPVPDPRLARVGSSTLTAAIDAQATEIPIAAPAPFRHRQSLSTAIIGQELVRYDAVTDAKPWKLLGCRRGAFGTRAAAHRSGADIGKLWDHPYKVFFPNLEMQDEVALRLADLFNRTGLRQTSFDGLEGCQATGQGAYAEARFVKTVFDRWDHDVINDSSQLKHYTWHIHTRMNWGEPWGKAMRESMPQYRFKNQAYFQRNLLPPMLGWYEIRVASRNLDATSLDEVEWVLAKCAGFGAGCAWHTSLYALDRLGNQEVLLDAIRRWDRARHAGSFTDAQRQRLRDPTREFHLEVAGDGTRKLVPVAFSPPFSVRGEDQQEGARPLADWELHNRFARQPLQLTLKVAAPSKGASGGAVANPTFEIGGRHVSFPVQLRSGQCLVVDAHGMGISYDANWNVLARAACHVPVLTLPAGTQRVGFRCGFAGDPAPRVEVRFKMVGPPEVVR